MSEQTIKLAIPSASSDGLNALVNPRFGRCEFFTIIQIEQNQIKQVIIFPNPGINAMGGAGPLAVQKIVDEGVQVIAGGDYGPNAMNALLQAGLKIYGYPMGYQNITVKALIELLLKNILPQINQANVPSHSGIGHRQRNGRR